MAILGKIRERSVFLIIIIALALFAFVLTGLFDANSPLFNKNTNYVGEINGENISREEFAKLVDQQSAITGSRSSQLQSVNNAWNNLVREKVYKTQLEKSGIVLGEKDLWDELLRQPFIQSSPEFKNEAGLFDEEKLKDFIATMKDEAEDNDQAKARWLGWLNYERNIKNNLELNTYNNLIKAGLGATIKEGEREYASKNTKLDIQYVSVPFTSIPDSTITVTDNEIKDYIMAHKEDFESEASRNLSFVKFDIKATAEDETEIKNELSKLINDREEYSSAAKNNVKIVGFANAEDMAQFFRDNNSDLPLDENFYQKNTLPDVLTDTVFKMDKGAVFGPYKDGEYFKLTKVVDFKQLPDSVKSRHILISHLGAAGADQNVTLTDAQAKAKADSLLTILKTDKSKFEDFVTQFSSDKGSVNNGGKYDWYAYNRMVPEFRDFSFEGKTGDLGVVKTNFGYHIIEIEGQKNQQNMVKLASFSRKIVPSEKTENAIFEEAETFASDLTDGKDFIELAKEKGYNVQPMMGVKAMDERVSSLGNQRQVVRWVFEDGTNENDVKRFDIENGYAVVKLDKKYKKGLSVGNNKLQIKTLLINQKKAKQIEEKMSSKSTLEEIATAFNTNVNSSKAVSGNSPVLPGVGRNPEVVEAISNLESGKLYKNIETKNGVFAVKIEKREEPSKLTNFNTYVKNVANRLQNKRGQSYEALKKAAAIEDNRAVFY